MNYGFCLIFPFYVHSSQNKTDFLCLKVTPPLYQTNILETSMAGSRIGFAESKKGSCMQWNVSMSMVGSAEFLLAKT